MTTFSSREQATEAALAANASHVHLVQTASGQKYIASHGDGKLVEFLIRGKKLPGVISVRESYRVSAPQTSHTSCERCKAACNGRLCRKCSDLKLAMNDCATGNIS